jgi:hypothetical protein
MEDVIEPASRTNAVKSRPAYEGGQGVALLLLAALEAVRIRH